MHLTHILLSTLVLVSGCTWQAWSGDFATPKSKFSPPPFEKLSIGMSKEETAKAIGKPDAIVGGQQIAGKLVEVWEYHQYEAVVGPDQICEKYQVVFENSRLTRYGTDVQNVTEIRMR